MSTDRNEWPPLVRLGLFGLSTRRAAWTYFWLAIAISIGCIAYGFTNRYWFAGGIFLFSALWYFLAIRWVDRHGGW